jgi:predicted outer membrane repeat protein
MKCWLPYWYLNLLTTWGWFSSSISPVHADIICSEVMIVSSYSEIVDAINCNANIIQIENNVTVIGTIVVQSLTNLKFLGNGHYLTSNEIQTFQFMNCTNIEIIDLNFYSQIQTEALMSFSNSSVLLSEVRGDQNQAPLLWMESSQIQVYQSNFTNTVSNLAGTIYCSHSDLEIDGTTFANNVAPGGAAIDAHLCNLLISQSIFQNNTASDSGGAISVEFSTISISDSMFLNNNCVTSGGALLLEQSDVNISSSSFVGNSCGDKTLPSSSYSGGAIYDLGSRISLIGVQFISNVAYGSGGAVSLTSENAHFENCEFLRNEALDGGALMLFNGNYQLLDCIVNENKADVLVTSGNGGGIYVSTHSTVVVERLECSGNTAIVSGGCFYLNSNFSLSCEDCQIFHNKAGTSVGSGGAISAIGRTPYRPSLSLTGNHCNISSNSGASGGAIASSLTTLTVRSCLILDNSGVTGGGFYFQSMYSVDLQQIQLVSNVVTSQGGGIFSTTSKMIIKDSQVNFNEVTGSQTGGGVYLGSQSILYLERVSLSGNSAGVASTLYATDSSEIYLNDSLVFNNAARQSATIYIRSSSQLSVENSTFVDNIGGATAGVAYCTSYSLCSFNSTIFSSNLALTYGGVVVVDLWAEVTLQNCVLNDNEGREAGGSLYATTYGKLTLDHVTISRSFSVGKGGVAFLSTFGSMTISNSELTSNSAAIGGAIHAEFNSDFDLQNVTMTDNFASYLGVCPSSLSLTLLPLIVYFLLFHRASSLLWILLKSLDLIYSFMTTMHSMVVVSISSSNALLIFITFTHEITLQPYKVDLFELQVL